jgi:3-oxoacyl-[acyl-carrier protein] reductase
MKAEAAPTSNNMRSFRLEGRTALVTGASRGIGRAIAFRFAREGAHVAINYLGNSAAGEEVLSSIRDFGGHAISIQADVSDEQQVQFMASFVLKTFHRIDILVNNAGIGILSPLLEIRGEDLDRMLAVNLKGTIHCVRAVAKAMIANRFGRIINISSAAAFGNTYPGTSAYAATKASLHGLTKRLALELGEFGITVNNVAPGRIRTDTAMRVGVDAEASVKRDTDDLASRAILQRIGEPEDIASAALFLASNEASFITAQTLCVDGGRTDLISYSG